MGIAERKEREKQEMQQRIVTAAKELFVKLGFEQTSIRKIAEAIEYSPAAIYRYFSSRDEIFFAVHEEIFDLLFQYMKAALTESHPVARLRSLGERYLSFAVENPEYYELLFVNAAPMNAEEAEEDWHSMENTFGLLQATIKSCIDEGHFPNKDLHTTTFAIWASIHGMITLNLSCRMKMYPEEFRLPLIRQSINMWVDALCKP